MRSFTSFRMTKKHMDTQQNINKPIKKIAISIYTVILIFIIIVATDYIYVNYFSNCGGRDNTICAGLALLILLLFLCVALVESMLSLSYITLCSRNFSTLDRFNKISLIIISVLLIFFILSALVIIFPHQFSFITHIITA